MKLFNLFKKKETHSPASFLAGVFAIALLVTFLPEIYVPQVNWKYMAFGMQRVDISEGLTVEKPQLVRLVEGEDPIFLEEENPVFKRGEKVIFALLNTGPFEKESSGMNWFEMNINITGPDGKQILFVEESLNGAGRMDLKSGYIAEPNGVFILGEDRESGQYNFKLTIYDKVGTGRAVRNKTFVVE